MDNRDAMNGFLNDLRESGITNMLGAGPFLEREFWLSPDEARAYLAEWMTTFGKRQKEA